MDPIRMGAFIAQKRRQRGLTQQKLAQPLGVTDKAVSKWERGLCCPDIALLAPLAELLGVGVNELLRGEPAPAPEEEALVSAALSYADAAQRAHNLGGRRIAALAVSGALLLGMLTCVICELSIRGSLGWAWYPILSCLLAGAVALPAILIPRRGVYWALGALSLLLLPFLAALDRLTGGAGVLRVGGPTGLAGLAYLWIIALLMRGMRRKWTAAGLCALIGIPVCALINGIVAGLLRIPAFDGWDLIDYGALLCAGLGLLWAGRKR